MSASIQIVHPGFYTTVQDGGRFGYAHLGVPESGAMDLDAFRLANALLNNDTNAALLECTLIGPKILIVQDCHVVITGAAATPKLDEIQITQGVPVQARAGQILSLSKITEGIRTYIAFTGGIETSIFLGSRSWYQPVTPQSRLKKGVEIKLGTSSYGNPKGAHLKVSQEHTKTSVMVVKAFAGPEYGLLTKGQKEKLMSTLTVSNLWNRMAVQLKESLENNVAPIKTSPVAPGTIQLTPSGKLIVLMRDCQTTGGYPRILQLSESAQNKFAQLSQDDNLRFEVEFLN